MLNLEQVKLLETKVAKAVDYVERLTGENAALRQKETELQAKVESYQKRIDELEIVMLQFKEDQGQIEDGILAALDKLNRFEEAMEKSLKGKPLAAKGVAVKDGAVKDAVKTRPAAPIAPHPAVAKPAPEGQTAGQPAGQPAGPAVAASENGEICFEIPNSTAAGDIDDPLGGESDEGLAAGSDNPAEDGELDIF
jgi:FtsZ-binding cell division protein ZapB